MRGLIGCMVAISALLSSPTYSTELDARSPLGHKLAEAFGTYVDHPDLPVPQYAICNSYAEKHMAFLKNKGIHAFYVTALVPEDKSPYLVSHVMVGFNVLKETGDSGGFETVIWDNTDAFTATDLQDIYGYIWTGIEINGIWYSVKDN